jgi:hypothetical protein
LTACAKRRVTPSTVTPIACDFTSPVIGRPFAPRAA